MATVPRYTYLISRNLDPLFALVVGLGAAYTRVNREQAEKGFDGADTRAQLRRRVAIAFGGAPALPPRRQQQQQQQGGT